MRAQALKNHALSVVSRLRERGHQAFLVGGCVRDLLLGREPADYDISTDATPAEVTRIFPETYAVGVQFGVVLVPVSTQDQETGEAELPADPLSQECEPNPPSGNHSRAGVVEVATFRSDIGYADGRHPDQVCFSKDPREDVARRDFTINGLLLDPLKNEILDFVGGQNDLKAGVVRSIGDPALRFEEDKLRMLRAVRFAARFEYTIDPETFLAIQKSSHRIHQVSRERVRDELSKMLIEGQARPAFLLLDESGLLKELLPEVSAMKGVEQPRQFHPEGDVFVHTLLLLQNLPRPCPVTLAWGALLHDVGKPPTFRITDRIRFDGHVEVGVKMAEQICRRFRFSNEETQQILALVKHHMRFGDAQRMKESTLKKFMRLPRFQEHLELHRLDCQSSHGDLTSYTFVRERLANTPQETMRPKPLVTGNDLIAAGYTPGPRFKEILSAVEDSQLEGQLQNKDDALEFVQQNFPI